MKLSIEVLEQFGINTLFNQSLKLNIISAIKAIEFLLFPKDDTIKDYGGITIYSFYHMQNVLFNCGQIFNLFNDKSQNSEISNRAIRLLKLYKLDKKRFPIIFDKCARNTWEHIDERIDSCRNIGGDLYVITEDISNFSKMCIENSTCLRIFNSVEKTYTSCDRDYNTVTIKLNDLNVELTELLEIVKSVNLMEGLIIHDENDET